jgi:ABC-type multidrug transport system ATPase subunit
MIVVEGLSQSYGKKQILAEVNLVVDKHERCALVGKNGAGKSTLIHSMLGLLPVKKGSVVLNGIPVRKEQWKPFVSYLPEKFTLYPLLTGWENIEFFASFAENGIDENKIEKTLKDVRLWDDRHARVKSYSKGMLQRLGLAIMLYYDSEIQILDEPTSGLDPIGRREILSILQTLTNKTILFSSHHMEEIQQICTHVAYLEDGFITKYTVEDFLSKLEEGEIVS